MIKYADDTYLIIPAPGVNTRSVEINNITNWATLKKFDPQHGKDDRNRNLRQSEKADTHAANAVARHHSSRLTLRLRRDANEETVSFRTHPTSDQ